MGATPLIIVLALVTYLTRAAGFVLAGRKVPPRVDRFLRHVPIAAFAGLVSSGLSPGTPDLTPRLIGVLAAVAVTLRWSKLWASVLAGMLAFWLTGWWLL